MTEKKREKILTRHDEHDDHLERMRIMKEAHKKRLER